MLARLQTFIQKHGLITPGQEVLLTVSGGLDSMVMVDLFAKTKIKFAIAHANFQLRGDDSEGDEQLVKETVQKLGVVFHGKRFATKEAAQKQGISIQMMARKLRYAWFEELCQEHQYAVIVTAHHANDQAETMLLHLVKGTGIRGLAAMQPKMGNRIKPLLFATREELEAYAADNHIAYREDVSNLSDQYERNYLRLHVIPDLKKLNPNLIHTLSDTAQNLRFAEQLFNERVTHYRKKLLVPADHDFHIPLRLLHSYPDPPRLLFELIHEYGFSFAQLEQAMELPMESTGQEFNSETHRLIKNRHLLILTSQRSGESTFITIHEGERHIALNEGRLHIERIEPSASLTFPKGENIATADASKLKFPLVVRRWKQGDYLYPLGLTKPKSDKIGKKKVSDLFTDIKLSKPDKERAWVLCSDKKIVWVVGYRLDDRFKVTPATTAIVRFRFEAEA